uniref:Conopeptide n=1 Tax=Conus lenavati TaxID=1519839 RepID=A0A0K8TTP5_CONLV
MSNIGIVVLIFLVLFPLATAQLDADQPADLQGEKRCGNLAKMYQQMKEVLNRGTRCGGSCTDDVCCKRSFLRGMALIAAEDRRRRTAMGW